FPPVYEGVILSRDLIRWPNSLCHYMRNIAAFCRVAKMAFTVQSKQVFKVSYDHRFSSDRVD
ncbi:hypothetical protein, partial [Aeromonas hydrophila]